MKTLHFDMNLCISVFIYWAFTVGGLLIPGRVGAAVAVGGAMGWLWCSVKYFLLVWKGEI